MKKTILNYISVHRKTILFFLTCFIIFSPLLFLLTKYKALNNENDAKILETSIQIYGTFTATLFGVLLSLYITLDLNQELEKNDNLKIMLGNLKVLWSELDLDETILKQLEDGLVSMPRVVSQLHNQTSYLIKHSINLKSKAFYATMSSGAINIISTNNEIFNDLQQAYYNIELAHGGLVLTNETFKDLAKPNFAAQSPGLVKMAFDNLDGDIDKIKRTISMVRKAKKSINSYLLKYGVVFKK